MENDQKLLLELFALSNQSDNFKTLINNLEIPNKSQFSETDQKNIKKIALAILFCVESYLEGIFLNENVLNSLMKHYFGESYQSDLPNVKAIMQGLKSLASQPITITDNTSEISVKYPLNNQKITISINKILEFLVNLSEKKRGVAAKTNGLSCYVLRQDTIKPRKGRSKTKKRQIEVTGQSQPKRSKRIAARRNDFNLITQAALLKPMLFGNGLLTDFHHLILLLLLYIEGHYRGKLLTVTECTCLLETYDPKITIDFNLINFYLDLLIKANLLTATRDSLTDKFLQDLGDGSAKVHLSSYKFPGNYFDGGKIIQKFLNWKGSGIPMKEKELRESMRESEISQDSQPSFYTWMMPFKKKNEKSEACEKNVPARKKDTEKVKNFLKSHDLTLRPENQYPHRRRSSTPKSDFEEEDEVKDISSSSKAEL